MSKQKTKMKTIPVTDEFASAMQQLSAEAEKVLPSSFVVADEQFEGADITALISERLEPRLEEMEKTIMAKIDNIVEQVEARGEVVDVDLATRFKRIDEQLTAIRSTESVNQRLFDSLHEELLKYRDNFLHESLQKPFIHDLVHLYDDLLKLDSQLRGAADSERGRGNASQWRDNLENSIHSLVEILERFEVKEIDAKEVVDRSLHKVVSFEPADFPEEDGRIVMRVKRGFVWRGKLIRPEEVIAKRFN
jgi:molecular chaperone GrpE (heat shock protein)